MNLDPCPGLELLEAFAAGSGEDAECRALEPHVARCLACTELVAALRQEQELEGRVRAHFAGPPRGAPAIAGFRILRELGRGGMGVVFEAEQISPPRRVALKVIRGSAWVDATTLQLFQREIRALARLEHPGIAALYDAGASEQGEHWFAMELVRGEPLSRRASRLERGRALELFRQLCDAIDYAHRRGVVHRDLKPSNVLVDDAGRVRVLDFGLAKITDQDVVATTVLSEPGALRGTLAYMSPEQARGDPDAIDQRSDVYSLGAMLYELLTGRIPIDVSGVHVHEAARRICDDAIERPSRVDASVRGELETIVQKALEKERERRYSSAAALGEDLRRYQEDEPILARPPSGLYHARKLVSRHRLAASMLAAVFALSLGTAVWTSVLYRREADLRVTADSERTKADHEAEVARRHALTAEKTKTFLVGVFGAGDLDKRDTTDVRASDLLVRGIEALDHELADEPVVRAELLRELGETLGNLGQLERAEPALEEAVLLRRAQTPPDRIALADALSTLGTLRQRQRRSAESIRLHEECLAIVQEIEGPDSYSATIALSNMAASVKDSGDLPRAEKLYREVLQRRRAKRAEDDPDVIKTRNDLAMTLSQLRRLGEAKELMEGVLADSRRLMPRSLRLCQALNGLAIQCTNLRQFDRAEALHLESIALRTELVGENEQAVGFSWSNLGQTYENSGRFQNAFDCYQRAREILVAIHGEEHANSVVALSNLSRALAGLGRLDEAEELAQRALAIRMHVFDPSHPDIAESHETVGKIRFSRGNFDGAIDELCLAVEGFARKLGEASPRAAIARANLGIALFGARRLVESEAALLAAFEAHSSNPDVPLSNIRNTASWLSRVYRAKGDGAEAEYFAGIERAAAAGL